VLSELFNAGFPNARLVLSIMGFLGMVNCYTLRVNLSVAIVAMVNQTYLSELEKTLHTANESGHSVCAVDEEEANKTNAIDIEVKEQSQVQ